MTSRTLGRRPSCTPRPAAGAGANDTGLCRSSPSAPVVQDQLHRCSKTQRRQACAPLTRQPPGLHEPAGGAARQPARLGTPKPPCGGPGETVPRGTGPPQEEATLQCRGASPPSRKGLNESPTVTHPVCLSVCLSLTLGFLTPLGPPESLPAQSPGRAQGMTALLSPGHPDRFAPSIFPGFPQASDRGGGSAPREPPLSVRLPERPRTKPSADAETCPATPSSKSLPKPALLPSAPGPGPTRPAKAGETILKGCSVCS